jgi:predicted RNA-binding protein with PIN domain
MTHYILDAHNVLHKRPAWNRLINNRQLAEARQALVNAVARLAERYPAFFFTLVFDGVNTGVRAPYRNIAVYESPRGTPADIIIKQRIDADPNPHECIVVSSDTEVHNYARRSGCTVMSAAEFLQELDRPRLSKGEKNSEAFARMKSGAAEKPSSASKREIDELKRLFGTGE